MKSKKIFLLILALPLLLGGSCEKRQFSFLSNVNIQESVTVDITDSFTEIVYISESDLRDFLDDLPKDAKVTKVEITSLGLRIKTLDGNSAKRINLSGSVEDQGSKTILFGDGDYPVPVIKPDFPLIGINNIIAEGLSIARGKIEGFIKKNDFSTLEVIIEGFTNTPGDRFVAGIDVRFAVQIEYEQCIEVWDYLEGGEECTITQEL